MGHFLKHKFQKLNAGRSIQRMWQKDEAFLEIKPGLITHEWGVSGT